MLRSWYVVEDAATGHALELTSPNEFATLGGARRAAIDAARTYPGSLAVVSKTRRVVSTFHPVVDVVREDQADGYAVTPDVEHMA